MVVVYYLPRHRVLSGRPPGRGLERAGTHSETVSLASERSSQIWIVSECEASLASEADGHLHVKLRYA